MEQYRHATYNPTDYYMEALSREPGDVRCNNAMGLFLMRRGQFAKAQSYFEAAIATLIERNPNPIDGEPHYNLGWSLKMQGKFDEAYDAFLKRLGVLPNKIPHITLLPKLIVLEMISRKLSNISIVHWCVTGTIIKHVS